MRKVLPLIVMPLLVLGFTSAQKPKVIQIDVSHILNARPVTVFYHGKLVTWTKGIDGGGAGDGYLTMQAALFNADKAPHALPDNAVFPANESHPEIVLHYSNNDTIGSQTLNVAGQGEFECNVPAHKYAGMFICLTSSEGPSQLQFELVYEDASTTQSFLLPDYYDDLKPNNPNITYVAHDLAKWNNQNKMAETDHHNIDAVNIHPDSGRVLKAVKVKKAKAGYLVFWGATGVVAE
jgi:hypothetical protein